MTRSVIVFVALMLCALLMGVPHKAFAVNDSAVFNGSATTLDLGGATLTAPQALAVDASGNLYIADTGGNRIVKVASDGTAAALAITGLSTALSSPQGIATDAAGNLYVADSGNSRIVMVTPAGVGSAFSTGSLSLNSPRGVTVDPLGNVFITDTGNNQVVEVPTGSGTPSAFAVSGLGTPLNAPVGIRADNTGNLYIADTGNNRVLKVTSGGAATVLSFGSLILSAPRGVSVDAFGTVYVSDTDNNRIVSSSTNQAVNTPTITLSAPVDVLVDPVGTLYVADMANNAAQVVSVSSVDLGRVAVGTVTPNLRTLSLTITGSLSAMTALTMGTPSLDFAIVSGSGTTCTVGGGSTTCTIQLRFNPRAGGVSRGALVLTGSGSNVLASIPIFAVGLAPSAFVLPATASVVAAPSASVYQPYQVTIDGAGNKIVTNYQSGSAPKVVKLSADGSTATPVSTGSVTLGSVTGVILDGAGNIYISDHLNSRVVLVPANGTPVALSITAGGTPLGFPTALDMDGGGNLLVADFTNGRLIKVSAASLATGSTSLTGAVVPTPGTTFTGSTVTGAAFDRFGNMFIAARTQKVFKATAAGSVSLLATPGVTLSNPQGVTADGSGNIYIIDSGRLIQMPISGTARVVQFAGLSSPATLTSIDFGVTVDPSGALYIPDWSNNRLVKLDPLSPAPLSFASTAVGQTSSPQTLTVQNVGNAPLIIPVPSSGSNPSVSVGFSLLGSGTCLQVSGSPAAGILAAGGSCSLAVAFSPATPGAQTGSLVLTNSTGNAAGPSYATQSVTLSGTGTQGSPTVTWTTPANIPYGTALSATQLNAVSSAPGTFAYTPAAGTVVPVGTSTLSVTFTPTDTAAYLTATATTALTVTTAATTIAVIQTAGTAGEVIFTATVAADYGTPTGTVDFTSGTTDLGSAPVDANGKAALSIASLPSGSASVTATYSGDTNYVASTADTTGLSNPPPTTASGYAISASPNEVTLHVNESADVALTFTPSGGFTGEVTVSCTGLPASMSCSLNPASFTADGSDQVQTGQLHIVAPRAILSATKDRGSPMVAGMLIGPGIFLSGLLGWRGRRPGIKRFLYLSAIAILGAVGGCSSGHVHPASVSTNVTVSAVASTNGANTQAVVIKITILE